MASAARARLKNVPVYALPTILEAFASVAVGIVIPGFYATQLGLSPSFIGAALLAGRLFDALTDPVIGALSDRLMGPRFGRKPVVLLGSVLLGIATCLLMNPPENAGGTYFVAWLFAYYAGWTLFAIPYDAWGAELSRDGPTRSRIFVWRAAFSFVGMGSFFALPLLPWFDDLSLSPEVIGIAGYTVLGLLPLAALAASIMVRPGPRLEQPALSARAIVKTIIANKPMLCYLLIAIISGLGNGLYTSLVYIYVVDYLKLSSWFSIILLANLVANLVALPLWASMLGRLGKRRAWSLGMALNALTTPMFLFIAPGPDAFWPALVVATLAGATYSICNVTLPAILGDIVDYDAWRHGISRTGSLFAVYSLIRKLNVAVGGGGAFLMIGAFGYVPGAENTGLALAGLFAAFVVAPTILQLLAARLAWSFPLGERRHAAIARRLDRRETARSAAIVAAR